MSISGGRELVARFAFALNGNMPGAVATIREAGETAEAGFNVYQKGTVSNGSRCETVRQTSTWGCCARVPRETHRELMVEFVVAQMPDVLTAEGVKVWHEAEPIYQLLSNGERSTTVSGVLVALKVPDSYVMKKLFTSYENLTSPHPAQTCHNTRQKSGVTGIVDTQAQDADNGKGRWHSPKGQEGSKQQPAQAAQPAGQTNSELPAQHVQPEQPAGHAERAPPQPAQSGPAQMDTDQQPEDAADKGLTSTSNPPIPCRRCVVVRRRC